MITSAPVVEQANRRHFVRLVQILFWMLIFEGSARKWLAPEYSTYLYFVRDPVVLYVYLHALRARLFGPPHPLMLVGLAFAALALLASCVHLGSGSDQYTLLLAGYGMRNYFLYLPLAFLLARNFEPDDLRWLAVASMTALLIAAPIAVLQFMSPPNSILNAGIATDSALQFQNLASGSGRVRPAGTFTSVMGMTQLIVSTTALLLWSWSSARPRPAPLWLTVLAAAAVATALAVSGSRTSFIHCGLVLLAALLIAPLLTGAATKLRTLLLPLAVALLFALLFPVLAPEAFQTFSDRWTDAAASEQARFQLGWMGRALYAFYDFFRLLGTMPALGYGVGMAGNGAVSMGVTLEGMSVLKVAEEDWSRHVIDLGPVLAVLFILYRVSFGFWLAANALRASLRSGDPLPVLLFAFVGVALVQGQITGHGLVNGFGWLYVGCCMAACRWLGERASQPLAQAASAAAPPRAAVAARYSNLMR